MKIQIALKINSLIYMFKYNTMGGEGFEPPATWPPAKLIYVFK